MRAFSVIILLAALVLPSVVPAEIQTFTATHTYILGDYDSKEAAANIEQLPKQLSSPELRYSLTFTLGRICRAGLWHACMRRAKAC
jgi:hypothetical protein